MSERDGYQPGVPCWVDTWQPDPEAAVGFYTQLFGWETDSFGEHTMWRVPGFVGGEPGQPVPRDVVAGMAPMGDAELQAGTPSHWSIDFWVEDADATTAKAAELGGKVVAPAFDTPVSRTAVLADPQGAGFSVSTVPGAVV